MPHGSTSTPFTSRTSSLPLIPSARKALYGVSYLKSICAQAGFPFSETPPGLDVQSIDGGVVFPQGQVHTQVKCTTTVPLDFSPDFSFPLKRQWLDAWAELGSPIYLIIVLVPDDNFPDWIFHSDEETTHKTSAYWVRVDPNMKGLTIRIPRANRLSIETLSEWHSDIREAFGLERL